MISGSGGTRYGNTLSLLYTEQDAAAIVADAVATNFKNSLRFISKTSLFVTCPTICRGFIGSVTCHTPTHLQTPSLIYSIHSFDISMTSFTCDTCSNMPFMREIHMFWKMMYLNPGYRLLVIPIFCQFHNLRAVNLDRFMAIHTD